MFIDHRDIFQGTILTSEQVRIKFNVLSLDFLYEYICKRDIS